MNNSNFVTTDNLTTKISELNNTYSECRKIVQNYIDKPKSSNLHTACQAVTLAEQCKIRIEILAKNLNFISSRSRSNMIRSFK